MLRQLLKRSISHISEAGVTRLALFFYTSLIACPLKYVVLVPGGDEQWEFGLNYAHEHGIKFGSEILFNYGLLGFIENPMAIGSNLLEAAVIQTICWGIFVGLVYYVAFVRRIRLENLVMFVLAFNVGIFRFEALSLLLDVEVLLIIAIAVDCHERQVYPHILLILLCSFLAFLKFSGFEFAMVAIAGYVFSIALRNVKLAIKIGSLLIGGTMLVSGLGFLLYDPSVAHLFNYFHNILAVSDSYSSTMSRSYHPIILLLALFNATLYAANVYWSRQTKSASFSVGFAFLLTVFMAFKIGFVRQDAHMVGSFIYILMAFGIILLFSEPGPYRILHRATLLIMVASTVFVVFQTGLSKRAVLRTVGIKQSMFIYDFVHLGSTIERLHFDADIALNKEKLPPELLARLSSNPVTVIPSEMQYAAVNPIKLRFIPTMGTFLAGSAFLDSINAHFFEDEATAPMYILFNFEQSDGRHPLDFQSTWLSIYRWYDFDWEANNFILFSRRTTARYGTTTTISSDMHLVRGVVEVPIVDGLVLARVKLRYSLLGRIAKTLYRIPEIDMELQTSDGLRFSYRVIPGPIGDGFMLNGLPNTLHDLTLLLNEDKVIHPTGSFQLYGDGLARFEDSMRVEFIRVDGDKVTNETLPAATQLAQKTTPTLWSIDMIDDSIVATQKDIVHIRQYTNEPIVVRGWAVDLDAQSIAAGVWVNIDERPYLALYHLNRADVAEGYKEEQYRWCGFTAWIPMDGFANIGDHVVTLSIVSKNSKSYYATGLENAKHFRFDQK